MSLWVCSVIEVVKRWSEHQWHTWLCPVCHFFGFYHTLMPSVFMEYFFNWTTFEATDTLVCHSVLYSKLSYVRILIGSRLWSIDLWSIVFNIIKTFFNSLLYKTIRFQVVVRLFSNRSQRTSKCGKNIIGIYLLSI